MKITMYELLGMVKDGKAPKKIKFNNIYCYYRECKNEYVDFTNKPIIQWDYVVMNSLNDEVEIIEGEKKIPKKLDLPKKFEIGGCNVRIGSLGFVPTESVVIDVVLSKINDIIDYLDYLKSKGE